MRILILTAFFPPQNSIASLRPYSWAKVWTLLGHKVTVVTPAKPISKTDLKFENPGYQVIETPLPFWLEKLKGSYQERAVQEEAQKNIFSPIIFLKNKSVALFNHLRHKKGVFNSSRMPDFLDFWKKRAWNSIPKEDPWDLVISTSGPYTVHLLASKLKKKELAKTWIADYRDNWSNSFVYPGIFPFNVIEPHLEKKIMKRADFLTTVSSPFARELEILHRRSKVFVIENGFDPSDLETLDKKKIFPGDGKFRIVYTGTIYSGKRGQDPSPLFAAIEKIASSPSLRPLLNKLEVLFPGPYQGNLKSLIDQYNVGDWVKMPGFLSRPEALRMQRDADYLLFLPWNDPNTDGVLTGKIFEYLFSKTPILSIGCEKIESSQQLILDAKAGICLKTVPSISNFLIEALTKGRDKPLIENDPFLEKYKRNFLAKKLIDLIELREKRND